jgi:uncharacterized RDD family membrane protein YckC
VPWVLWAALTVLSMNTTFNTPPAPITPPVASYASYDEPASVGRRALGLIIDGFFFGLLIAATMFLMMLPVKLTNSFALAALLLPLSFLAAILLPFIASIWMLNRDGQTPGMRVMDVALVDSETGYVPGFGKIVGRTLLASFLSSFFGINYIWAIFHPENKTLHDLIVGTTVIDNR